MSAVLSPWFSVVLFLVCGSSEGLKITKEPGEDVTLTCKDEKKYSLIVLEWSRDGQSPKEVFVYRGGKPTPAVTHESFWNRVFLKDSQMKDGDLSVVLKNVTMNDSGIYQCRVLHENDQQREPILISTIRLSVDPPGDPSPGDPSPGEQGGLEGDQEGKNEDGGTKKEGLSSGWIIGIVLAVLVAVAAVGLWIYRRRRCPNQRRSNII